MMLINTHDKGTALLEKVPVLRAAQSVVAWKNRTATLWGFLFFVTLLFAAAGFCGEGGTIYSKSPVPTLEEISTIEQKAKEGDAESQLNLGIFYANGDLVEQDYAKAAEWYGKAAENGEARAQRYYGLLFYTGVGVKRDRKAAYDWFIKADKGGDVAAGLEISAYPLFYRESIMQYNQGSFNAWRLRAFILLNSTDKTPSYEFCFWEKYNKQFMYFQNDEILAATVAKMASNGNEEAQVDMVAMHILGQGLPVDSDKIEYWLQRAVHSDNPYALFMLGFSDENPYFKQPNIERRAKLIEHSAALGAENYFKLIWWYVQLNPSKNLDRKVRKYLLLHMLSENNYFESKLYTNSIKKDIHSLAQHYGLAQMVLAFLNTYETDDYASVSSLLEKAASNNVVEANKALMMFYGFGVGGMVDYEKSLECARILYGYRNNTFQLSSDFFDSILVEKGKKSVESLMEWVSNKARNGDVNAQRMASMLYGIIGNNEMKFKWDAIIVLNNDPSPFASLAPEIIIMCLNKAVKPESITGKAKVRRSIYDLLDEDDLNQIVFSVIEYIQQQYPAYYERITYSNSDFFSLFALAAARQLDYYGILLLTPDNLGGGKNEYRTLIEKYFSKNEWKLDQDSYLLSLCSFMLLSNYNAQYTSIEWDEILKGEPHLFIRLGLYPALGSLSF